MVCILEMPNSLSRAAHRLMVNILPLSVVIVDGTLNFVNQPFTSTNAQDSVVILTYDIASNQTEGNLLFKVSMFWAKDIL